MSFKKIIPTITLFLFSTFILSAQVTIVKGVVRDGSDNEPLIGATIVYEGTTIGTTSDWDGSFELPEMDDMSLISIEVGYTGYEKKIVAIEPGKEQFLEVFTEEVGVIGEVVTVIRKRPKKDSAAIVLFKRVVKAKEKLRESEYDSYTYEDYTKMEFDLYNVKENMKDKKILKPFGFIFENIDTTEEGIPFLPLMLKEKISDVYYRKNPKREKEVVKADRFSGVENKQLYSLTDYTFPDIDIYDKTVLLGTKSFVNPFSAGAGTFYRYFLEDSMQIDDKYCYKLDFAPRRKGDLAFTGHAWVDKETAMIKSLDIIVLDKININFLTGLEIRQEFDDLGDGNWFKTYERMEVMMNLLENKKKQAVRVVKTTNHKDIKINEEIDGEILKGGPVIVAKDAYEKDDTFWDGARHEELSENEAAIYTTVKRVKKTKAFKVYNYLGNSFSTGYFNAGKVDFGRFFQTYSWNGLEGDRVRLGMRTSPKHFKDKFVIGGYGAYGFKDKQFKYHIGANVHLKRKNNKWHMLGGHYRYDWSDYNFKNPYMTHDHILTSLFRSQKDPLTNLFLIREGYGFYEKEWIHGLTNKFSFKHRRVYSWDNSSYDVTDDPLAPEKFEAVELKVETTYGPGQLFIGRQGGASRQAVDISAPVFKVDYTVGLKDVLGGDYNYHTAMVSMQHKLTSRAGQTFYTVGATKTWGDIPYPLLTIHKGSRSFLYNRHLYNMMDDLEYVNDQFVYLDARHFFDGVIMNAIPGVNRLKLRTMMYGKVLYGGMSDNNKLLLTENSSSLKPLEGAYAEVGVGILNIFKVIQIYGFMRVVPDDTSPVSRFGFKFNIGTSL